VHSLRESLLVNGDVGPTGAAVHLGPHELSQAVHHSLDLVGQLTSRGQHQGLDVVVAHIYLLKHSNGEGGGLACS